MERSPDARRRTVPQSSLEVILVAIHNPARIPAVAEILRQELLAAVRRERLTQASRPGRSPILTRRGRR